MGDNFVIKGPEPLQPLPEKTLGQIVYECLVNNCGKCDAIVSENLFLSQ